MSSAQWESIVLFGPPGSGKGTVGAFLAVSGAALHISSGDIFRGLSPHSPLGKLFHENANAGMLAPDEAAIQVWAGYINGLIATNRFFPERQWLLLDGVPRTLPQAKLLEAHVHIKKIIVLDIKDRNTLLKRLQRRSGLEGRADDANTEVLQRRLDIYDAQTAAVLSHYPVSLVTHINGEQKPLQVARDVLIALADLI